MRQLFNNIANQPPVSEVVHFVYMWIYSLQEEKQRGGRDLLIAQETFGYYMFGGENYDMCGVCFIWHAQGAFIYNCEGSLGEEK